MARKNRRVRRTRKPDALPMSTGPLKVGYSGYAVERIENYRSAPVTYRLVATATGIRKEYI